MKEPKQRVSKRKTELVVRFQPRPDPNAPLEPPLRPRVRPEPPPKRKRVRIRRRGRIVKFRLLEEDRDLVFLAAARARLSMTQWIRARILAAAKVEGQHPLPEE